MITRFALAPYIERLKLAGIIEPTLNAIRSCRENVVKGFEASSRSISMFCHSVKMGLAFKVGSKLEFAALLSDEFNELVSGYYLKAGELPLSYINSDGKKISVRHRPDGLRLLQIPETPPKGGIKPEDLIRFRECKSWNVLAEETKKGDRYVFDKDLGRYRCPSAEDAAHKFFGFGYDVLTERDLDPIIVANVEYLYVYFDKRAKSVPVPIVESVRKSVAARQGIHLSELMADCPGLTKDHFCKLVVDEKLYVPLEICHLDLASTVQVFTDRLSYEAIGVLAPKVPANRLQVRNRFPAFDPGELITVLGRNYTVVAASNETVQFKNERGESCVMTMTDLKRLLKDRQISSLGIPANDQDSARKLLLTTPPSTLASALARYEILKPILEGKRRRQDERRRIPNAKEWLRRARRALIQYKNPLIGCIDNRCSQGWRGSHLSPDAEQLITEVIDTHYSSTVAPKKSAAYGYYRNRCKELSRVPVSEKTFNKRIAKYAADKLAGKRAGNMAAAGLEAPVAEDTILSGAGRWQLHIAHLDEFILDLALIFPELGVPLGTAWVALMIDSYTRTVLALFVSFEAPGYVTTMMLLRGCLFRWGRLPEVLFMDNGPGYKNLSLVLFAQYYHIQLCWRPPGRPRWGAEIEKAAGDINGRIAGELPGATKLLSKYRRLSKSHHPDTLAVFGIKAASEILKEWCYTIFDTLPHGGLHGKSPRTMREISQIEHGVRSHLAISDDPLFEIISLPAPEGDGTAKVQAHDGVQVDNLYYWHDKFHYPDVVGTYVDVRWDPLDITKAYAYVRDEWVECECIKLRKLRRLSKEDLCAVSLEIRKGRSDYNRARESVLERVASFLDSERKSGEALAHLLRTKASAKQFLESIKPPRLDDDEEPKSASNDEPAPRPKIPGFSGEVVNAN